MDMKSHRNIQILKLKKRSQSHNFREAEELLCILFIKNHQIKNLKVLFEVYSKSVYYRVLFGKCASLVTHISCNFWHLFSLKWLTKLFKQFQKADISVVVNFKNLHAKISIKIGWTGNVWCYLFSLSRKFGQSFLPYEVVPESENLRG